MPLVSILMAVHNGETYLAESIQSILGQTWQDLEFIIVDDGSNDETPAILAEYGRRDSRMRILRQPHCGLAPSLNVGLAAAVGEYIARMDADDVSLPERMARQLGYLSSHPRVGVCGTWMELFGARTNELWRYPMEDDTIRSLLVFNSPLAHPTVVIRGDLLRAANGYSAARSVTEDYDLWVRLRKRTEFHNLPEALLRHRVHAGQVTGRDCAQQVRHESEAIHTELINQLGIQPTPHEMATHEAISDWRLSSDKGFVRDVAAWLDRLHTANQEAGQFPNQAFARVLAERWWAVCWEARSLGTWTWRQWVKSSLKQSASVSSSRVAHFAVACLRYQFL